MKKYLSKLVLLFLTLTVMVSCGSDEESYRPSKTTFNQLQDNALAHLKQNFQFNASNAAATFTSAKGVVITVNGSCLTLNGNPVTGLVNMEYTEIFNAGLMAITNRPTRGAKSDGTISMLVSGGEFLIRITKNGQPLETGCSVQLQVPASLTGGINPDMTLWEGVMTDTINGNDELIWDEFVDGGQENFVVAEGQNYYVSFGDFGWTNVDIFYNNPGPKTTLLAEVPGGYDFNNCAVYLSYNDQPHALAKLDKWDPDGYFTEHYGQIPIGLQCHAIFVTEENGSFRYAIKPVTITDGGIITFTFAETQVGSEVQLTSAIDALHN